MNKKTIIIGLFLLLCSFASFAHEPAIPLDQGQLDLSWYWSITGGCEYREFWTFEDYDLEKPTAVIIAPITSEYDISHGGSLFLAEYGIFDFLSAGIRLSLFDFMLNGIHDSRLNLQGSLYTRFNIFSNDNIYIHFFSECQVAPLISIPKSNWIGDGLINLFNTASFNYKIMDKDNVQLFGYLDLKYITSFVNTSYNADPFNINIGIDFPPEILNALKVSYGNINRIAIAPGAELKWGTFFFNLGINFSLYDFSSYPLYQYNYMPSFKKFFDQLWLNNLEFSWRWRF